MFKTYNVDEKLLKSMIFSSNLERACIDTKIGDCSLRFLASSLTIQIFLHILSILELCRIPKIICYFYYFQNSMHLLVTPTTIKIWKNFGKNKQKESTIIIFFYVLRTFSQLNHGY